MSAGSLQLLRTTLAIATGELTALPRPSSWFQWVHFVAEWVGMDRKGREGLIRGRRQMGSEGSYE